MRKLKRLLSAVLMIALLAGFAPPAQQALENLVEIAVSAGYDGYFREGHWLPLRIQVDNNGEDIEGQLVVRPETSINAVSSTFSTPVSLPSGTRKTVYLYIVPRSIASRVRVEFIGNDDLVMSSQEVALRGIQPRDQLYVVVSQAASGTVDLTGVRAGSYSAFQANWQVDHIPDKVMALDSVDVMLFSDIDSGTLTSGQREAIADWVANGGHLIVTGGPNWQATAAGFTDLLPVIPQDNQTVDNLNVLMDWSKQRPNSLNGQTVLTNSTLQPGGWSLVNSGGSPLIARRGYGDGTVDYLAADPNIQPLRSWAGLTDLWLALISSVNPHPSWAYPITEWDQAATATNILPGVNLLPDILPLLGFLTLYIVLIGPVNYAILNRLNRRELAWATIPILIVVFSVVAWTIGFNLRGTNVTFSRIAVVQSWSDVEQAQAKTLIGLLSPRRAQYSFTLPDGEFLHPISRTIDNTLIAGNLQNSTDIAEGAVFSANDFSVDASFIASFYSSGALPRPEISGSARLLYTDDGRQMTLRGSVRNDTDQTLHDAVVLARGQTYRFTEPLAPGEIATFQLTLPGEDLPSPAPIAYAPGGFTTLFGYRAYQDRTDQTTRDILGEAFLTDRDVFRGVGNSVAEQEAYRRRLFLEALMTDAYGTTGRGDRAYLAAWADGAPLDITVPDTDWGSVDTTLYLTELEIEFTPPTQQVLITGDQFTWVSLSNVGGNTDTPIGLSLQPGDETVLRYTPLPGHVLAQVDEFTIDIDHNSRTGRNMPIDLWNWDTGVWETIRFINTSQLTINHPTPYLGPNNAVEVRIVADDAGGFVRIQDMTIEQRGRF
ncbi:MAG: hypothetical protein H6672_03870 [Anaerolineaceae bacterium]|nr:hypothetical protein [Anaerolineaceae bacterium]